jgi:uncharacterized lipoprotein YddW (UPF0748 family)/N-acetylmuramoyl-L-alanine amidase
MRGLWVTTVLRLDYPSSGELTVEELQAEAIAILDNAARWGFNAIILQVRPTSDAFYPSALFPWSHWITNEQGVGPGFDLLQFWIGESHKRGMELHAWINPFRITMGTSANPQHDLNALAPNNPARMNPSWVVRHTDGRMYFNPGLPEVRQLVIDGVAELVRNYNLDGIHFDDYFYPGVNFDDAAAFQRYGGGMARDDWRRDNVNRLVKDIFDAVKAINPRVRFGISPVGVWANQVNHPLGSNTTGGFEAYYRQYADTRLWVKNGWLDYIAPQIYWHAGHPSADYDILFDWWVDVVRGTRVDLYIGTADYGLDPSEAIWNRLTQTQRAAEIRRQANRRIAEPLVAGSMHFRYRHIRDIPVLHNLYRELWAADRLPENFPLPGRDPLPLPSPAPDFVTPAAAGSLMIGRPAGNISTTSTTYYIMGASDPTKPLYMNGTAVTDRSPSGFFGIQVRNLVVGANRFVFTQPGAEVVLTLTRTTAVTQRPQPMVRAEIVAGSTYPHNADEYRRPGETVTLRATAPIGANVTVRIGGQTFAMVPATRTPPANDGQSYPTAYTVTYTIPQTSVSGQIINLGAPIYTMTYRGHTSSRTATGNIHSLTHNAPFYATVAADWAFVYPGSTTTGGPAGELVKGQRDTITAVTSNGDWVRLGGTGYWIRNANIERSKPAAITTETLGAALHTIGGRWETLRLPMMVPSAGKIEIVGRNVRVTVPGVRNAPRPVLPMGSIFSGVTATHSGNTAVYTYALRPDASLDGYIFAIEDGALLVRFKPKPRAASVSRPLEGFTFVIDPGHGGSSLGTTGPLGRLAPEKDIVLAMSLHLRDELIRRGARVYLTRSTDVDLSLADRVNFSRNVLPDMFLSIHTDSLDEFSNARGVHGVNAFFTQPLSRPAADYLALALHERLGLGRRSPRRENFQVTQPFFAPHVLIEAGFASSPDDFEWMATDAGQRRFALGLADALVDWFRG